MKKLFTIFLLIIFISTSHAQSYWAQEEDNLRGRMQYYHTGGGNIGYSIRTSEGGGWAWQLVNGSNTPWFHVDYTSGNVGIGTDNPLDKLDILGGLRFNGNADMRVFGSTRVGRNTVVVDGQWDELEIKGRVIEWTGSNLHIGFENDHTGHYIEMGRNVDQLHFISSSNIETMRLINGNVGIGTTNPQSRLAVDGQIRATEVKVLADVSVPDYVFESDYELRTLKETKEYITENKHLPEIPSASEIGENGIDLGDMNMRLLKKIEELTLYQINLLERLEKAEKKISKLENEN
ncbi:MAG: hypothetical protein ABJP45_15910 [Cyclobacteriaceae bacterium]